MTQQEILAAVAARNARIAEVLRQPDRPRFREIGRMFGVSQATVTNVARDHQLMGPPFVRPLADRYWERVVQGPDCWAWKGLTTSAGYGRLTRRRTPDTKSTEDLAHRISWELHFGPIPVGLWVLHHCDNPPCSNPAHLFLGTAKDNVIDAARKGRMAGKLTLGDVRRIRSMVGRSSSEIAREFGIDPRTAHMVAIGKQRRHVE